jgi:uncharacterized protein YbjT (DUF2867 family)
MSPSETPRPPVLIAGASGYVGRRLMAELERREVPVRCMARQPSHMSSAASRGVEVVEADVLEADSLGAALEGVRQAFYLVHSMGSSGEFAEDDRIGAENFAAAAKAAGVRRIVYLGALGVGDDLSEHLESRQEVGRLLAGTGVPVIEFRASIVIGSGSLSFELVRALVERLPIMVTPKWVHVRAQPIGIEDLIAYLTAALELPGEESRIYEIGGAQAMSYGDLMQAYAAERGLKRRTIDVPILSPRLSGLWLGLVTPLYARIGRKLIESIMNETVVRDDAALRDFDIAPISAEEAISAALRFEDREMAESHWYDAVSSAGKVKTWAGVRFGNRLMDARSRRVGVPAAQAFAPIRRIGGKTGWYAFDWLWDVRGAMDELVGGVGVRRGRAHPDDLAEGQALDFWRVEKYEPDHLLRLKAEMKLPGRARLEFEVTPDGEGAVIKQTAVYDPVGFLGFMYWYSIYPLHVLVFGRMLANIAKAAEREDAAPRTAAPS